MSVDPVLEGGSATNAKLSIGEIPMSSAIV